jgi:hypothetical protein
VRYTTELTTPTWFYLRGEEYSAQLDYFAQSIASERRDGKNTFRSALTTDRVVNMIRNPQDLVPHATSGNGTKGWLGRLLTKSAT